jgi:hypothetical protein
MEDTLTRIVSDLVGRLSGLPTLRGAINPVARLWTRPHVEASR